MDVTKLLETARNVIKNAYAPYSGFRVAAAVITDDHNVFWGVNVENSSFGLTICAERVAVSSAITAGKRNISQVIIFAETNEPVPPCGACRQFISEFGEDIDVVSCSLNTGKCISWNLKDLLPFSFKLD